MSRASAGCSAGFSGSFSGAFSGSGCGASGAFSLSCAGSTFSSIGSGGSFFLLLIYISLYYEFVVHARRGRLAAAQPLRERPGY